MYLKQPARRGLGDGLSISAQNLLSSTYVIPNALAPAPVTIGNPGIDQLPENAIWSTFAQIGNQTAKDALAQFNNTGEGLLQQIQDWISQNSAAVYVGAGALFLLALLKGRR